MHLPTSLMSSINDLPGFNREAFVHVHESGEQVTSIRLNPIKSISLSEISTSLHLDIKSSVNWCSFGYYLPERPVFTLDPLFHAGCYYVQEASSMFLEQALKQTVDLSRPLRVLDLCAAPGGKSTLIQSILHSESLLVSNEVIKTRVNVLQENMIKWGGRNVVVTNNDAKDFARLENYFDVMVIDAPCSGSGLFRRDPEAIAEWSPSNVELCSQRQKRIIADALPSLKKDGVIIYSTCSYSREEDEDILDWLGEQFAVASLKLDVPPDWEIVESVSKSMKYLGYRFYPDKIKGEGFFIAAVRKLEGEENHRSSSKKKNLDGATKNELGIVKNWIRSDADIKIFRQGDELLAIPSAIENDIPILQRNLYLKQAGITLGKPALKEFIPDHALAMSDLIAPEFVSISLNKEDALQYLRKGDVFIDVGQRGWVLVKYYGINLGWIKNLGNRINNYYPKDWRILMR